jgi:hypothetical protein
MACANFTLQKGNQQQLQEQQKQQQQHHNQQQQKQQHYYQRQQQQQFPIKKVFLNHSITDLSGKHAPPVS